MKKKSFQVSLVILIFFLPLFEHSLLFSQQTFSMKDTTLANEYFAKGKKLYKAAQYDSSVVYFHLASETYGKLSKQTGEIPFWDRYFYSNAYIGANLRKKGVVDSALTIIDKTLELGRNKLGARHLTVAFILDVRAWIYSRKADYSRSLNDFNTSLKIRQEKLGENHKEVADSYNGIGGIYLNTGKFNESLDFYEKSLRIRRVVLGEAHADVGGSYNNIGIVYALRSDYDKALDYLKKSLQIKIKMLGDNHLSVSKSFNNIGGIYEGKGDYENALKYYNKGLTIELNVLGKMHSDVAGSYSNIASVYNDQGDHDRALDFHQRALAIRLNTLGPNHPETSESYNNLGVVHFMKRNYDRAVEFYKKALDINIQRLGERHHRVADNYMNIGVTYEAVGDYQKALDAENKALRIYKEKLGENNLKVGRDLTNIGVIYRKMKNFNNALIFFERARSISLTSLGEYHPEVADIYNRIGRTYFERNNPDSALYHFQKSIKSSVSTFENNSIYDNPSQSELIPDKNLLTSLSLKAKALTKLYLQGPNEIRYLDTSLSTYRLASKVIDNIRSAYKAEGSKLLLGRQASQIYNAAIKTALLMYKVTLDHRYRKQAFTFVEKSKSAVLWQSLSDSRAKQFVGLSDKLLQKERDLKIDLAYYDTEIQKEKQKKDNRDSLKIVDFEQRFFDLNRQYETLITDLENNYPKYYDLKYQTRTTTMSAVQAALDDRTALIEYSVGDTNLVVFVISKSKFDVINSRIDSTFAESVRQMVRSIKKLDKPGFLAGSQKLHAVLIQPIEHLLVNKNKLVIIPDGALRYLPFEALVSEEKTMAVKSGTPAPTNFAELDYLVNRFEISYHHSATMYLNQTSAPEKELSLAGYFIGFAPVFRSDFKGGRIAATHRAALDTSRNEEAVRSVTVDGVRLNELKHTEEEVEAIVDLFGGEKQQSFGYFHREASEENFKAEVGKYKYVHIATHGLINKAQPKLSGLVFSQPTDSTYSEDGILYSGETYNLDLNADLLVLSSCESGIGKLVKGEGLMALTRGFIYAGTPNIVFSLWKVSDRYTRDLMVEFYRHVVSGKRYSKALRQGKLQMIADEATAFPFLWSSFVLVGR